MDDWQTALAKSKIPLRMHEGISRWITDGIKPGSFLHAVLRNDLIDAVNFADEENRPLLREYTLFLYNYAPMGCWGAEHRVRHWEADHIARRERLEP